MPAVARNAAFTAMEIATVAELYPARLIIGLGHGMAGWMRQIGAYPRSPLTALAEHIQAIRALLAGETVSVTGDYVQLDGVRGVAEAFETIRSRIRATLPPETAERLISNIADDLRRI